MNDKAKKFTKEIGTICSIFRKYQLKKTLKELSQDTGVKVSTLSAFENGRSTNIELMYLYISLCETQEQTDYLIKALIATIETYTGGY